MDFFLDEVNKKRVSDEIRQRKREEKLAKVESVSLKKTSRYRLIKGCFVRKIRKNKGKNSFRKYPRGSRRTGWFDTFSIFPKRIGFKHQLFQYYGRARIEFFGWLTRANNTKLWSLSSINGNANLFSFVWKTLRCRCPCWLCNPRSYLVLLSIWESSYSETRWDSIWKTS